MLAALEPPLESASDSTLLLRTLLSGRRRDGRGADEARPLSFTFTRSDGRASAEVALGGSTRVHAAVTADLATPHPDKPLEGFLTFHVEVLPSASRAAEFPAGGARAPFSAVHVSRVLERQLRDARAIDTEALCVVPGERVWALRCDVRVVEDGGNAADAASAAALAALLHFRRPDVTLRGRGVMVHGARERAPLPLAVHHTPITLSWGCLPVEAARAGGGGAPPAGGGDVIEGALLLRDPTLAEERLCDGSLTLCVNAHGELCGMHKLGGCPLPPPLVAAAVARAAAAAAAACEQLRAALTAAEVAAAAEAVKAHAAAAAALTA
jgi:exosome complex component RRP45